MKKRFVLLSVLLLLSVLPMAGVGAIDDLLTGPQTMAQYFPAETVLFGAIRTDEAYLDQLDGLGERLIDGVDTGSVPLLTPREQLDLLLAPENLSTGQLLDLFGDYAALGYVGYDDFDGPQEALLVAEIADRAGVEALLMRLNDDFIVGSEGGYTTFLSEDDQLLIGLSDTLFIAVDDSMGLPQFPLETPLHKSDKFVAAISELPAPSYNILAYADMEVLTGDLVRDAAVSGITFETPGPLAAGFTILDENTLAIDTVQRLATPASSVTVNSIDPVFPRFIPADATVVTHATDLSGLYERLMATLTDVTAASGEPAPQVQVELALAALGLDLEADLLNWTTGDYAIFGRLDVVPVLEGLLGNQFDINNRFDVGMVIEATDAIAAQNFANTVAELMTQFTAGLEGVTITADEIAGVGVTVLETTASLDPSSFVDFDIVVGANDVIFFLATRPAAETILTGDGVLLNAPDYIAAQPYVLPNATSVWYTDGEGFLIGNGAPVIVVLALLGPAIGNIFENIIEELETAPQAAAPLAPQTIAYQTQDEVALLIEQLAAFGALVRNSTASATVTADGTTLIRLTVTYNE
ncbi:MAG: DUF3352 domain-containing protein [Chloroflexi bacterium]|nr:DUF3352 domain-containing protein [Chloroflexota bacterium]